MRLSISTFVSGRNKSSVAIATPGEKKREAQALQARRSRSRIEGGGVGGDAAARRPHHLQYTHIKRRRVNGQANVLFLFSSRQGARRSQTLAHSRRRALS